MKEINLSKETFNLITKDFIKLLSDTNKDYTKNLSQCNISFDLYLEDTLECMFADLHFNNNKMFLDVSITDFIIYIKFVFPSFFESHKEEIKKDLIKEKINFDFNSFFN